MNPARLELARLELARLKSAERAGPLATEISATTAHRQACRRIAAPCHFALVFIQTAQAPGRVTESNPNEFIVNSGAAKGEAAISPLIAPRTIASELAAGRLAFPRGLC
jgi:hypothetical protein